MPLLAEPGPCAARYGRSHSEIGLGDYLIAATALELRLATLNTRHFPMVASLQPAFELR